MMREDLIKTKRLPCGLTCYVIPKKGYVEKQAALSVHYGSVDTDFRINGGEKIETPQGTAHFLEHKLFESEEGNMFQLFTRLGAAVNAFTSFTDTSYYFTAVDRFEESLSLLFECVGRSAGRPYFTDENVEKEKGIINQEINMYRDDPHWMSYINLQGALFHQSPVRNDIAGTVESVAAMDKAILYRCYEAFYTPSNMALICAGDLEAERIYELAERMMAGRRVAETTAEGLPDANNITVERFYGSEPKHARSAYTEMHMPVSIPMFQLGFKDTQMPSSGKQLGLRLASSMMLVDIIAGESSPLYADLYNGGFVDNHFSVSYIGSTFYGTSLFSGPSANPKHAASMILAEIKRLQTDGIPSARFDIIKRKSIGRYLRGLNRLDHIVSSQTDLHGKGLDIAAFGEVFSQCTVNDAEECLHTHFRDDNHALSVVWNRPDNP